MPGHQQLPGTTGLAELPVAELGAAVLTAWCAFSTSCARRAPT